jgi:hypothetical protein
MTGALCFAGSSRVAHRIRFAAIMVVWCVGALGGGSGSGSAAVMARMLGEAPSVHVVLVPAPVALRRGCQQAAQRLDVIVFCPTRVPRGWVPAQVCAGCNGTFSATGWFPAPPTYRGQPGEHTGHFTVWAASPQKVRRGFVGCLNGKRGRPIHIEDRSFAWVTCPPGSTLDAAHVLLQWSHAGWLYAISLHADTTVNRDLLRRIASSISIVKP